MDKKTLTLDQAQEFVEHNQYKISESNKLARCVDGRYSGDDMPVIATPGGDAGFVMTAFAALNKLSVTIDPSLVLKAVESDCGGVSKFQFHSDKHAQHDRAEHGMGCGHLKQARLNPESYGVTKEQMEFLFSKLPDILEQGGHEEVLEGDHQEQMVLVVDSENYSVKPNRTLPDGSIEEAFVYHQTLDAEMQQKLSNQLFELIAEQGNPVDQQKVLDEVIEAAGLQRTETLKRLATGLPGYLAKISDSGAVHISQL